MSKQEIAAALFRMKKAGQEVMDIKGHLYSSDELLTMFFGREIPEDVGHEFCVKV